MSEISHPVIIICSLPLTMPVVLCHFLSPSNTLGHQGCPGDEHDNKPEITKYIVNCYFKDT